MSDLSGTLHDILSQEFEYDRAKSYEFGWCTIVEAEDRLSRRPVRIYVPRDDVWSNGNAKKIIKKQFQEYFKEALHECLPEAIELIEGKNAGGSMFLVTRRSSEKNLMASERTGEGIDWIGNDKASMPEKLGAMRKMVQAVNLLHEFGMVHGALGHQTLSCIRDNDTLLLQIDLLNFGDINVEEPASSLFFEPAFTAPEVFDGGPEEPEKKSKESDVYSLGKFVLYFLMGPAAFIKFFTNDEEASSDEKEISSKLTDHILWTNLAHSELELDGAKLAMLSGEKISPEISEFLSYSVSMDRGMRPDDAEVFYHGLMTIMGGDIADVGMMEAPGGGGRSSSGGDGPNMAVIGGIAAAVLLLAGGGFMFMQNNAKKKAVAAQYASTGQACKAFGGAVSALKESRIISLPGWSDIEFLRAKISENGQAEGKLGQTQEYCEKGVSQLNTLRGNLIASFKSDIESGIENSVAEGTDFSGLGIDDVLSQSDKAMAARNFPEVETLLGGLSDTINEQRDLVLVAELERAEKENRSASKLLGTTKQSTEEKGLLSKVRSALPLSISSANLPKKKLAAERLQSFDLKRLTKAGSDRLEQVSNVMTGLDKADADDANIGYSDVLAEFTGLKSKGLPESTSGFASFFGVLGTLDVSLNRMTGHMDGLAAELPRLTENISSLLDTADKNQWIDEPQIATLGSQFNNRESFSTYKDWSFLNKISGSLGAEMGKLEEQWAEGQSACNAMMSAIEGVDDMSTTLIWGDLSGIISRINGIDQASLTRSDFDQCAQGYSLAKRGNIELDARELLTEIKTSDASLKEGGIGFFIEDYTLAIGALEDLKVQNIPQDETSYDDYSTKAYAILAGFDKAREAFSAANAANATLTTEFTTLVESITATPLGNHPEFLSTAAGAVVADANVMEQNASLTDGITALQSLITRFEAGELINCSFEGGFNLLPVLLSDEQLVVGTDMVKKAALDAGIALPVSENTSLGFCLNAKPVSVADMEAFNSTLRPQQGDIKAEIENVKEGAEGAATNISFWLARRYAEFVSTTVGKPVCVAPAFATVLAKSQSGAAVDTTSGELFGDGCGSESAIGKNLVLSEIGGEMKASCVSNNSLQSNLVFRIASGDVCPATAQ